MAPPNTPAPAVHGLLGRHRLQAVVAIREDVSHRSGGRGETASRASRPKKPTPPQPYIPPAGLWK
eukprot:gene24489-biopygen11904